MIENTSCFYMYIFFISEVVCICLSVSLFGYFNLYTYALFQLIEVLCIVSLLCYTPSRTTSGRWVILDLVDPALKYILIELVIVMLHHWLTMMILRALKYGTLCLSRYSFASLIQLHSLECGEVSPFWFVYYACVMQWILNGY